MGLDSLKFGVGCALNEEARRVGGVQAMKTRNSFAEQVDFVLPGRGWHDLVAAFQDHFGSRTEAGLEAARYVGQ